MHARSSPCHAEMSLQLGIGSERERTNERMDGLDLDSAPHKVGNINNAYGVHHADRLQLLQYSLVICNLVPVRDCPGRPDGIDGPTARIHRCHHYNKHSTSPAPGRQAILLHNDPTAIGDCLLASVMHAVQAQAAATDYSSTYAYT